MGKRRSRRRALVLAGALCTAVATSVFISVGVFWGPGRSLRIRPEPEAPTPESVPALGMTEEALREEAIGVATRLVADFTGNLESLLYMADVHVLTGDTAAAIRCWDTCIELAPGFIGSYRCLAEHALFRGQFERAATLARKALELDPKAIGVNGQLGRALEAMGRPEEALAALQKDVEISLAATSYFELAKAYQQLGQYDKAKENYITALRMVPDYTEACYGMAAVSVRLGQAEDAAKYRQKFEQMKARDVGRATGDKNGIERLTELRHNVAAAYVNAGAVYADNEQSVMAEKHWLRAAALAPESTKSRKNLVLLYQKDGLYDKALPMMEQLIRIEPRNPEFHWGFSILLANVDRIDDALSEIQQAMQLDPGDSAYRQVYQQLLLRKQMK